MSKKKKVKNLKKIYERTLSLEDNIITLEIQIIKQQEDLNKDREIPKFLADMY